MLLKSELISYWLHAQIFFRFQKLGSVLKKEANLSILTVEFPVAQFYTQTDIMLCCH